MKQRIRIQNKDKTARIFLPVHDFADLIRHMHEHGGKTAFMWNAREGEEKDGAINYELLSEEIELAAAALTEEGLAGGRIAFLGTPSVTYAVFMLATLATGGVIIPLDHERPTEDIAELLTRAGATALFYGNGIKADPAALCALEGLSLVCATERVLPLPEHPKAKRYAELLLSGARVLTPGTRFAFPSVHPDKPAAMLFTSGSPKGRKCAVLSAKNLAAAITAACASVDLEKADLVLSVLPFHHSYALSSLFVLFNYGVTVAINDIPAHFYDNLQKYRPTGLLLVPLYIGAMYNRLWETNKQLKHARGLHYGIKASNVLFNLGIDIRKHLFNRTRTFFGGRLTKIVSGGAPLNPALISAFEALGIAVYEGYGLTECGPFVTVTPYFARRVGSVGIPLPGVTLRIESADSKRGEHGYVEGEIEVKSESVMLGYDSDENANKAAFTLDGYFRTGDIGYVDKNGYLFVTGKKKTVIVLDNGRNVAPEELEEYLTALPEVADAFVYTKRDEHDILRLYAKILPSEEFREGKDEGELLDGLRMVLISVNARLPRFKQIRDISLVSAPFPRSAAGKILRDFVI